MKSYLNYILLVVVSLLTFSTTAQENIEYKNASLSHDIGKKKMIYFGNDFDGALLTIANGAKPVGTTSINTPRFTYFFNIGFNMHVDFNNTVGVFTGIGIKNIGFIEKTTTLNAQLAISRDSTIKRRVYTVGLPLGLKIGNLKRRNYAIIGGGIDFPFNYREKGFVKRNDKDKFNEWFSDRTARVMPYVFAGFSIDPGIIFKVQYYPSNFMNPNYIETNTKFVSPLVVSKPYAGYDVQLLMFSIGFDIHYKNDRKHRKQEESAIKIM